MQSLTDKQQLVLEAIQHHIALTGHSPTVREIGAAVDLKSSCSVQKHLDNLERLGKIQRTSFKYRSIALVEEMPARHALAWANAGFVVPLLGTVSGGAPAARAVSGTAPVKNNDPKLLLVPHTGVCGSDRAAQANHCATRNYENAPYFALTVKGHSMQGAGIGDNDVVIARRQRTAEDGQIVIARIGSGDMTVKRLFHEGRHIRLQPDNPSYKSILSQATEVIGRVTMAIKQF